MPAPWLQRIGQAPTAIDTDVAGRQVLSRTGWAEQRLGLIERWAGRWLPRSARTGAELIFAQRFVARGRSVAATDTDTAMPGLPAAAVVDRGGVADQGLSGEPAAPIASGVRLEDQVDDQTDVSTTASAPGIRVSGSAGRSAPMVPPGSGTGSGASAVGGSLALPLVRAGVMTADPSAPSTAALVPSASGTAVVGAGLGDYLARRATGGGVIAIKAPVVRSGSPGAAPAPGVAARMPRRLTERVSATSATAGSGAPLRHSAAGPRVGRSSAAGTIGVGASLQPEPAVPGVWRETRTAGGAPDGGRGIRHDGDGDGGQGAGRSDQVASGAPRSGSTVSELSPVRQDPVAGVLARQISGDGATGLGSPDPAGGTGLPLASGRLVRHAVSATEPSVSSARALYSSGDGPSGADEPVRVGRVPVGSLTRVSAGPVHPEDLGSARPLHSARLLRRAHAVADGEGWVARSVSSGESGDAEPTPRLVWRTPTSGGSGWGGVPGWSGPPAGGVDRGHPVTRITGRSVSGTEVVRRPETGGTDAAASGPASASSSSAPPLSGPVAVQPPDPEVLAEQVARILARRLGIERERRGGGAAWR